MMRAGALRSSSPTSSFVSRNGPSTFVANVSSNPSTDSMRSPVSTPALLTSTSRRSCSALKRAEKPRTDASELRSQSATATRRLPVRAAISSRACSPRSALRASRLNVCAQLGKALCRGEADP